mmetsp:Transcript_44839/g.93943  ORF Transcript_44839/g.93943 Transcript_44839/m.93943 type:complete len:198 (-) Transcript_44839:293-886(-)
MGAIVCIPCDDTISDGETLQNTRLNHVTSKDGSSPFHKIDCDEDCIISLLASVEPIYKKRKSSVEFHSCEDQIKRLETPSSYSARIRIRGLSPRPSSHKSGNQLARSARSVHLDPKSNVPGFHNFQNPRIIFNRSVPHCKGVHDVSGENCNGNSEVQNPIPITERRVKLQPLPARIVLNVLGIRDKTCAAQHHDFSG